MTGDKKKATGKVVSKANTAGKAAKSDAKTKATGKTAVKSVGKADSGKTDVRKTGKSSGGSKTGIKKARVGKATAKTPLKAAAKAKTKSKTAGSGTKTGSKPVKSRRSFPKIDWQAFTEKMEHTLMDQKSMIIETLISSNKDFKEIVEGMDPKDFADSASDDIDRKMIEALGSQELKRLKLIDSTLTRIKQGKYGYCIKCDRRIPPDRLEAIPYALMCIDCKSEEERRNR